MNPEFIRHLPGRLLRAIGLALMALAPMQTPARASAAASRSASPAGDSSPGGQIVFQTTIGGLIDIVNADGTGLRQLTTGIDPAWSPDGKQVAFTRYGGTAPGLYLIHRDGSNEALIFRGNEVREPSWSPDGSQIAFNKLTDRIKEMRYFPGRPPIWTGRWIDIRSMGMVKVADDSYTDLPSERTHSVSPSWLPDGNTIIFRGDNGLSETSASDHETQALLNDARLDSPMVSPTGNRVVMMSHIHNEWDIVATNPDGSGLTELTQFDPLADQKIDNVAPAWSPDGQSIIFLSNRTGDWQPFIMNADGSNLHVLFPHGLPGIQFNYRYAAERVFSWTR